MNTEHISLSNDEKLELFFSLGTMLTAGITIVEAVDSILEDAKGNLKKFLSVLRTDLLQGKRINTTFQKFPDMFDRVTVNVIKASEEAGTLDSSLQQLKDNLQKDMEFMDKVKSALFYPVFIFFVFIGVLLMILIVVIPKINTVFSNLKMTLPLPTRILIAASGFILSNGILLIIGLFVSFVCILVTYKRFKKKLIQFIFSFPLISHLVQEIDLTRFTLNLHILLKSGIIITSALDLVEDIVVNKQVAKLILTARDTVASGKKLTEAFKKYKNVIPNLMMKIIETGEKSGRLDESLLEVSQYMDYKVSRTLKSLTTLLEPVMLIFIGILVGGMMLSIISPIYGLIGQVGPH